MSEMMVLPTMWWQTAPGLLDGSVMSVATSGEQHLMPGSQEWKADAHSVLKSKKPSGLGTQPLQKVRTLKWYLSWHNGITSAMQLGKTSLTVQGCKATSRSGGSVLTAQQGRSTDGLQRHIIELPPRVAVPSVLGSLLADVQTLYPDTAAEWDHDQNEGQASDYPASSKCLVWWYSLQRDSKHNASQDCKAATYSAAANFRQLIFNNRARLCHA